MADKLFLNGFDHVDIFECGRLDIAIKLTCPVCQHGRSFDAYALWALFNQRGWSLKLKDVAKHFHCIPCGLAKRRVRPVLKFGTDAVNDDILKRPSEREIEAEVKRRLR